MLVLLVRVDVIAVVPQDRAHILVRVRNPAELRCLQWN
jgi:hypothetical protein